MSRRSSLSAITPEIVLQAYSVGIFPMAESADDPGLFWVEPERRGIFPLDQIRVSRSLGKAVSSDRFEIRIDHDFDQVIAYCAEPSKGREQTWINQRIRLLYRELFDRGYVHTVECYEDGQLRGGLYGLAIGQAFFGESMFHKTRDASKVALIHLVARLRYGGFTLLDTQFVTPHLARLGAVEVSRRAYRTMLSRAVSGAANFHAWPVQKAMSGSEALFFVYNSRIDRPEN